MAHFTDQVLDVVRKIPRGKTMSYTQVARLAGNAKASRKVGEIMSKNTDRSMPCHRVIYSNGRVGEYNRLQGEKADLLRREGVIIQNNHIIT